MSAVLAPFPVAQQREALLKVRALQKRYLAKSGESVHALADVEFDIGGGEFVAVVGPSGCGKSTLLKIFAGLLPKTSGEILLGGREITGPRPDIGVVFQDAVLLPWLNVLENVLIPAKVQKLDLAKYRQRALELLRSMARLEGFERSYPNELSGGMRQRVAICRAILHDPAILLMDEPFGALDAMTRERMNLELQDIWLSSGKTVFFITHSVGEAVFLADRVLVMSARPGRIVDELQVSLPRPRRLETMATEAFGAYTSRIRRALESKGSLD